MLGAIGASVSALMAGASSASSSGASSAPRTDDTPSSTAWQYIMIASPYIKLCYSALLMFSYPVMSYSGRKSMHRLLLEIVGVFQMCFGGASGAEGGQGGDAGIGGELDAALLDDQNRALQPHEIDSRLASPMPGANNPNTSALASMADDTLRLDDGIVQYDEQGVALDNVSAFGWVCSLLLFLVFSFFLVLLIFFNVHSLFCSFSSLKSKFGSRYESIAREGIARGSAGSGLSPRKNKALANEAAAPRLTWTDTLIRILEALFLVVITTFAAIFLPNITVIFGLTGSVTATALMCVALREGRGGWMSG